MFYPVTKRQGVFLVFFLFSHFSTARKLIRVFAFPSVTLGVLGSLKNIHYLQFRITQCIMSPSTMHKRRSDTVTNSLEVTAYWLQYNVNNVTKYIYDFY